MTVGQFFLGMVAIFVATIVYRWQKSIDRETQLQSERRKLYAQYLTLLSEQRLSQPMLYDGKSQEEIDAWMNIGDGEIAMYAARDELWLLAPTSVQEKLVACDEAFRAWKIAFSTNFADPHAEIKRDKIRDSDNDLRDAGQSLRIEMRKDLEKHGLMPFPKYMSAFARLKK